MRTIILLILNMIEYILEFSLMFAGLYAIYNNPLFKLNLIDSFNLFMNVSDLTAFDGINFLYLVYFETIIDIFMNILCIARFIGELPEVKKLQ